MHDLRNHGRNPLGSIEGHTLPALALDHDLILEAVNAEYGRAPTVGVYHSVSALAALLAPSNGGMLAALVLFDPPLRRPGIQHEVFDDASIELAERTRRQSSYYRSRADFVDILGFSPNFRGVRPGVAELAAETMLQEAAGRDGYELRCPRQYEAQIVEYARIFTIMVDFRSYACPVKVIGADPTLPSSFLPTLDLREMVGVNYDFLPDATHMLQLQQPAESVAAMREFLETQGLL